MQYNSLRLYMRNIISLKLHYNFSIDEVENLMPWERDVYLDLIKEAIEKNG